MPHPRTSRSGHLVARFGPLVVFAVATASCEVPNFRGPQIQSPPRGFLLTPDSPLERRMFQHHDVVFQSTWVESVTDFSTIHINGHPGVLGLEEVMAAQDTARRYAGDRDVTFGGVEPLTVDGREAWGWEERVQTPGRGLVWVAYRAAVPYDSVTYAIEFYSGDPRFKNAAPDTLKAIITTFAVGETRVSMPLIALVAGGLLFLVAGLRSRARAREARLQAIHLVRIKKTKPEEGEEAASAGATAPGSGGPGAGSGGHGAGSGGHAAAPPPPTPGAAPRPPTSSAPPGAGPKKPPR